jgi:hypothetical protein
MGRAWVVGFAFVALIGCGAGTKRVKTPEPEVGDVTPTPDEVPDSAWEHEAPLLAPDEQEAQAAPRLPQSKTIGDEGAYDLGRAKGRVGPAVGPRPLSAPPTYYRGGRGYARGGYRGGSSLGNTGASAGSGPAVAGNWPSAPSYGPRTMK